MRGQGSSLILRNTVVQNFKNHFENIRLLLCPIVQNFSSLSLLYTMVAMLFGTNLIFIKKCKIFRLGTLTLNLI